MRNLDQKRALFALESVNQTSIDKDKANEIKIQSSKLIALIQTSGFLQAMDYAANNFKESTYTYLCLWFAQPKKKDGPGFDDELRSAAQKIELHKFLARTTDSNQYRQAMQEAVAFLGWLKSKAEGRKNELKDEKSSQKKTEEV